MLNLPPLLLLLSCAHWLCCCVKWTHFFPHFFFTFIALYLGLVGEKNIQRQPPVPSSTNYWYMSTIKMFMQSITEIHCLKAMGAYPTGIKRSYKKSGQWKHWKGLRSYKKTSRKDREQWIGQTQPKQPKRGTPIAMRQVFQGGMGSGNVFVV